MSEYTLIAVIVHPAPQTAAVKAGNGNIACQPLLPALHRGCLPAFLYFVCVRQCIKVLLHGLSFVGNCRQQLPETAKLRLLFRKPRPLLVADSNCRRTKPRLHCQSCVALLLNTHSKNSKLWVVSTIQWLILVYGNSVSYYGPDCINISCVSPFISSLTSVCSVKVSHMTGSVYPA